METIKVNMTPCDEVQTIHASQNDGEAREWGFALHNNGDVIDSSSISDQLVFKSYEGGTEQLLPENTSTPTTTPILADIQYPDGLRTDQYFTYRETPTTVSNKARIKTIKGNTLVWNQLVQNGNFADTSNWSSYSTSFTVSDNIATITATSQWGRISNTPFKLINAHKYLVTSTVKGTTNNYVDTGIGTKYLTTNNKWEIVSFIIEPTSTSNRSIIIGDRRSSGWTPFYAKNTMCFDLTLMFGAGNEPATLEEFAMLFPLPYYDYNAGSLLSFNGNGIKTVGKNILVNNGYVQGVLGWNNSPSDSNITANNNYISSPFIPIPNGVTQITITSPKGNIVRYWEADSGYNGLYFSGNHPIQGETITRTLSKGCKYVRISIGIDGTGVTPNDYGTLVYGQIEFGNQASSYEAYQEDTLSLPISTYFPTGMKSAGSVYDELTETKAITRIGSRAYQSGDESDASVITDGTTTYYALATPTETSFTTASLVTENAEIPLSNEDGVLIGKCTEQLSSKSGFFDAKIKLTDSDGTCYSNKIQLHIERSPQ